MTKTMNTLTTLSACTVLIMALMGDSSVFAATATWLGTSGAWSNGGIWSGGSPADGTDSTANFTGVNISADQTITLNDIGRTIGNITFTDLTTASNNLTISGSNILTLDRTGVNVTKPVIDVTQSGRTLTISAQISGDDGLQKNGAGALVLSGNNLYSGGTTISAGTVTVGHNNAFGTGTITVTGNSTIDAVYGIFPVIPNELVVNPGVTLTTVGSTQYFGQTFSGKVSGSGTIATASSGNNSNTNNKLGLTSALNDFTGTLINSGGSAIINVNSLGDGGQIRLYANSSGTGGFALGAGTAVPLEFNTRQVVLYGSSAIYSNNNTGRIQIRSATPGNKQEASRVVG
ncbi:MAG: hypothetical protein GC164_16280 [Phycisphaera sp.]|nr:hypothetical protein [Phycisphaera sp.]